MEADNNDASGGAHAGWANVGLTWLSLNAGYTEVLTFLKLGDIFTSTMTGNTALLGISLRTACSPRRIP